MGGNSIGYSDRNGLLPFIPLILISDIFGRDLIQMIGAIGDFGDSFGDMMNATHGVGKSHKGWANQDKYFHCRANCEASQRGSMGKCTATKISDAREWFDQTVKGDPASSSVADQVANFYGRDQGSAHPIGNCKQLCGVYRPGGSFPDEF